MASVEYIVIISYLILLLAVGWYFKRFNKDTNDFLKGGCRGTWWLVGMSSFMSAFSAWTFTGAAGVAFESGFSVMIIYFGNALGFFINFLFIGPWFRQLRVTTGPEVIRLRFGPAIQKFYAFMEVPTRILYAAVHLYGLGIFCSAVFGYDILLVILIAGIVVVFYSTSGGRWAVMATDFLQGLLLLPITVIVAVLCLREMGGVSGMFELIETQDLMGDFKLINAPEQFAGSFTWGWASAMVLKNFLSYNTVNVAYRYFSVKDGAAAKKAALLSMILMLSGAIFWFIPPVAARLLMSEEVLSLAISKPAEASYAVISMLLLPAGLTGMIVVAILTATMSSMDTGLNTNVAILMRDIYPAFCRLFGVKEKDEATLLRFGRIYTLFLGAAIILLAMYFSKAEGKGIFDIMLDMGALLATPMAIPLVYGMFFRNTPQWTGFACIIGGFIPSTIAFFSAGLFGEEWLFQTKVMAVFIGGSIGFFVSLAFPKSKSQEYLDSVNEFFRRMHTPVDFEKEIGESNDQSQLGSIGKLALAIAGFIALLLFVPNPPEGRVTILILSISIATVGGLLTYMGRKANRDISK